MARFHLLSVIALALTALANADEAAQMAAFDLEFYDDFVANTLTYYGEYYEFLIGHNFNVPSQYGNALSEIFEGADFTSMLSADPGLVTVLYNIVTEFPWYSSFDATATIKRIGDFAATTAAPGAVATSDVVSADAGQVNSVPVTSAPAVNSAASATSSASSSTGSSAVPTTSSPAIAPSSSTSSSATASVSGSGATTTGPFVAGVAVLAMGCILLL